MKTLGYYMLPLALLSVSPALASTVMFHDGDFGNITVAAEYNSDSANTTSSAAQCLTCGLSGTKGLQLQATFGASAAGNPNGSNSLPQTTFAIVDNLFVYDPLTQGAISSIDASVAKDFSSTENSAGIGNTFRPLIEQDGNFYLAAIAGPILNGPGTTGYQTIAGTGLTAADFILFNFTTGVFGTGNPNFAGDPIEFGLAQNFNLADGSANTADYDNLAITLTTTPLPSTWSIMILGLAGIGVMAYRRKRKADLLGAYTGNNPAAIATA